jgi:hypothetical protein
MTNKQITVGICPRERFSKATASLASILEHTSIPYNLIIVDCNTPYPIWSEIEAMIVGLNNVEIIRADDYILPADCKTRIVERTNTPYVCLVENDVLVGECWAENFLLSCKENHADVVAPLIYEVFDQFPERTPSPHFDDGLGIIESKDTDEGSKLFVRPRATSRFADPGTEARPVQFVESHCLFFRREIFHLLPGLDTACNASEDVDLCMALRHAGARVIFDPSCTVIFAQPPLPVAPIDRDYFELRWNPESARMSHERLLKRWNLGEPPQLLGYWYERYAKGLDALVEWRDIISDALGDKQFILVDEEQFRYSDLTKDLSVIPFMEKHGAYWGAPASDDAALEELEKSIAAGARGIVFTWNTFWYFKYYKNFATALDRRFRRVIDHEFIVAYDFS